MPPYNNLNPIFYRKKQNTYDCPLNRFLENNCQALDAKVQKIEYHPYRHLVFVPASFNYHQHAKIWKGSKKQKVS